MRQWPEASHRGWGGPADTKREENWEPLHRHFLVSPSWLEALAQYQPAGTRRVKEGATEAAAPQLTAWLRLTLEAFSSQAAFASMNDRIAGLESRLAALEGVLGLQDGNGSEALRLANELVELMAEGGIPETTTIPEDYDPSVVVED